MNKIIFVTQPDLIQGETYAIKNYSNNDIKKILSTCESTSAFYLIDKDAPHRWLQSVVKQSKIVFDFATGGTDRIDIDFTDSIKAKIFKHKK